MKLSSFNYLLKQGLSSIWKNKMMSFASFCIILVSLLMVGLSVLSTININTIIRGIEDKNEVVVVIKDDANQTAIDELATQIQGIPNVKETVFHSKDEAWKAMKDSMTSDEQDLFQYADNNPLPNTFRVKIDDISKLKETVSGISLLNNIDSIKSPNDFADLLVNIRNVVTIVSSALVIALVIVSMVIISNTTRASVFSRRKEINIMKFVGAKNYFIRIPFFIEGMTIGIVASLGALLVTRYAYEAFYNVLTSNITLRNAFGTSSLLPIDSIFWKVALAYVFAGALIGSFGSIISTRKHLKV